MVELDKETIVQLQLEINVQTVRSAIMNDSKLKLKEEAVRVESIHSIAVHILGYSDKGNKSEILLELHRLENRLPQVIVAGLPTVERAIIRKIDDPVYPNRSQFQILAEGTNLLDVFGISGVDGHRTTTNHIMETERVLGIEAARSRIITEIEETMIAFGIFVDHRHTMLLADCMTYKGEVLGITRTGISKMKDSVLHAASFEKTADHLFDAALHGRVDNVNGVSESIIMGIPMPTGTGMFKLLYNDDGAGIPDPRNDPVCIEMR